MSRQNHLRDLILFLILAIFPLLSGIARADVVKPTLVEISVFSEGVYRVEIRASIEALLTGINNQYQNTQDAPNAQAYDDLRVLEPEDLQKAFKPFMQEYLDQINVSFDGVRSPATITSVTIPEPGYTKVPRISLIIIEGEAPETAKTVSWYYPERFADNAVRVRQVDLENEKWHWSDWQWLRNDEISEPFSLTEVFARQSTWTVIKTYIEAGILHILPSGMDHILFILGIFLLSARMKPLLWQVTMFTIAHSITLGLTMTGYISIPAYIVEPLIALSIAYVGIENVFSPGLHKSRLFIVFLFGLLHGMGFASMLADFGMPADRFFTALISFNIGVEIGQLLVILAAFLLVGIWFRDKPWYRRVIVVPGSLAIGIIGLYWTWDRIVFDVPGL
jgi:hydrogenase/urease accessory protein HupE